MVSEVDDTKRFIQQLSQKCDLTRDRRSPLSLRSKFGPTDGGVAANGVKYAVAKSCRSLGEAKAVHYCPEKCAERHRGVWSYRYELAKDSSVRPLPWTNLMQVFLNDSKVTPFGRHRRHSNLENLLYNIPIPLLLKSLFQPAFRWRGLRICQFQDIARVAAVQKAFQATGGRRSRRLP